MTSLKTKSNNNIILGDLPGIYNLSESDYSFIKDKYRRQSDFLDNNFIVIDGNRVSYKQLTKTFYFNTHRYLAEFYHRLYSFVDIAKDKKLRAHFITITLPSPFHRYKQIVTKSGKIIYRKNGDYRDFFIDHTGKLVENNVKNQVKHLSYLWRKFCQTRAFRDIKFHDRMYIRVVEPHKNGTPHLHVVLFAPSRYTDILMHTFYNIFDGYSSSEFRPLFTGDPEIDKGLPTEFVKSEGENIASVITYTAKYVIKSLESFAEYFSSNNDDDHFDPDNFIDYFADDVNMWYFRHGVRRFYFSRHLPPIDIYRKLRPLGYSILDIKKLLDKGRMALFFHPKDPYKRIDLIFIDDKMVYTHPNFAMRDKMFKDYEQRNIILDDYTEIILEFNYSSPIHYFNADTLEYDILENDDCDDIDYVMNIGRLDDYDIYNDYY